MVPRVLTCSVSLWIAGVACAQCDRWEAVPGLELPGTNGPIADILTWDPDGPGGEGELLVAGGTFTAAGSVLARNVCVWDGVAFRAMGEGIAGEVNGVCAVGTQLYAAAYEGGVSRVYAWDGTGWDVLPGEFRCTLGCDSRPIVGLANVNGVLFAAGSATEISGAAIGRVASWNGAAWSAVTPGYNIAVRRVRTNGVRTFFDTCERVGSAWSCPSRCNASSTFVSVAPFGSGAAWLNYTRTASQTTWSVCGAISGGTVNMRPDEIATTASEAVVFGAREDPNNLNRREPGLALVVRTGGPNELLQFGVNSGVDAVRFRGELVIAGDFTDVNEAPARNIAIKRGTVWESLNRAPFTAAQAVGTLGGDLVVFNSGPRGQADGSVSGAVSSRRWRAGVWEPRLALGDSLGPTGVVFRAREWQGNLLATTAVRGGGGILSYCFVNSGSGWSSITGSRWSELVEFAGEVWFRQANPNGVAFNGAAYRALTTDEGVGLPYVVWNGELYGVANGGWARLNGQRRWDVLLPFTGNQHISAAAVYNGEIVASGFFADAAGGTYGGVAAWTGSGWRRVGEPLMFSAPIMPSIPALAVHRGVLYAGGTFGLTLNGVTRRNLVRYDPTINGGTWRQVEGVGGVVWQLADSGDALWVCGDFTTAGDVGTVGLAKYVTNPCAADLDCSGGVDSDDTIQFFAWWEASDGRADVNGDGGVDSDDTIAFFERWEAGC